MQLNIALCHEDSTIDMVTNISRQVSFLVNQGSRNFHYFLIVRFIFSVVVFTFPQRYSFYFRWLTISSAAIQTHKSNNPSTALFQVRIQIMLETSIILHIHSRMVRLKQILAAKTGRIQVRYWSTGRIMYNVLATWILLTEIVKTKIVQFWNLLIQMRSKGQEAPTTV